MFRLLLLCVRSLGTCFLTVCLHSLLHILQRVHAGGKMRQSEQCYVLYSQTVQRNANRQQRWRGTKETVYKGEADGVTVWRGKGWVGRVEVKGIHSTYVLFSSHILYTHIHRGRNSF